MNKRLFSNLTILAFAFALVLGFGAINYSNANDLIPESYPGQVNLFGNDQAHNGIGTLAADQDIAPRAAVDSYGLQGAWLSTL